MVVVMVVAVVVGVRTKGSLSSARPQGSRDIARPRMRDRQIRKEVFKWMNYLKECLSFVSSL